MDFGFGCEWGKVGSGFLLVVLDGLAGVDDNSVQPSLTVRVCGSTNNEGDLK